jgi:hypothetical protein
MSSLTLVSIDPFIDIVNLYNRKPSCILCPFQISIYYSKIQLLHKLIMSSSSWNRSESSVLNILCSGKGVIIRLYSSYHFFFPTTDFLHRPEGGLQAHFCTLIFVRRAKPTFLSNLNTFRFANLFSSQPFPCAYLEYHFP